MAAETLRKRSVPTQQLQAVKSSVRERKPSITGELFNVDQVPEHFHELFILSGYRNPRSSAWQCVTSMFSLTNETINIWTHFIPSLYFAWRILFIDWGRLRLDEDPYAYPMMAFVCTLGLYPAASCVAHIFNTMSDRARHICFFLDYWALSLYGLGAAIGYRAYSFPVCLYHTWFSDVFLWVAVIAAMVCFVMSCETRFLPNGIQKKVFRISAFAVPYIYDCIPIIYRALFGGNDEWIYGGLHYHMRQFVFAFLSAFLYTSHIPERLQPGRFDYVGHSHQIFHIISFFGTHDQLEGMQLDMVERRNLLNDHDMSVPSYSSSFLLVIAVSVFNLVILLYFCQKLDVVIAHAASTGSFMASPDSCRSSGDHITPHTNDTKLRSNNDLQNRHVNSHCNHDDTEQTNGTCRLIADTLEITSNHPCHQLSDNPPHCKNHQLSENQPPCTNLLLNDNNLTA